MRKYLNFIIDSITALCVVIFTFIVLMLAASDIAAQTPPEVYRCGAMTTKGQPCKIRVKTFGAKCHHHADDSTTASNGEQVYRCGATTAKGTPCKMRVKTFGQRCYYHQ